MSKPLTRLQDWTTHPCTNCEEPIPKGDRYGAFRADDPYEEAYVCERCLRRAIAEIDAAQLGIAKTTTQPLLSTQTIRAAECERLSRWLDVLEKGIPFADPRVAELVREMRERWLTLLRDDVREVSA